MGDFLWPVVILMLMLLALLGIAIFTGDTKESRRSDDSHDA